jgi:hypothetical protein
MVPPACGIAAVILNMQAPKVRGARRRGTDATQFLTVSTPGRREVSTTLKAGCDHPVGHAGVGQLNPAALKTDAVAFW